MKKLAIFLAIAILSLSASQMRADGIGTTVSGTLALSSPYNGVNWFDPTQGFVPAGYGNSLPGSASVIIGAGTEFGFQGNDIYSADFTGNTLTISDYCRQSGCGLSAWVMTFTDPAFLGFTQLSNSLATYSGPGSGYSFSGNTLTVTFNPMQNKAGYNPGSTLGTDVFDYATPTPEPASIALFATGVLGMAGMIRRRFTA